MSRGNVVSIAVLGATLVVVVGCATPRPVRDLAEKTGANVSFVSSHLELLAQDGRRLSGVRAASLARLHDVLVEVRLRHQTDLEVMKRAGAGTAVTLFNELRGFADKIMELQAEAGRAAAERRDQITKTQQALVVPSERLAGIAKDVTELGSDDDPKARILFLRGYAEEVVKAYETRDKERKAADAKLKEAASRSEGGKTP